jgi:hypothetical protein
MACMVGHTVLIPNDVTIQAGGAVDFVVGGSHQVVIYDNRTQPDDINAALAYPAPNLACAPHRSTFLRCRGHVARHHHTAGRLWPRGDRRWEGLDVLWGFAHPTDARPNSCREPADRRVCPTCGAERKTRSRLEVMTRAAISSLWQAVRVAEERCMARRLENRSRPTNSNRRRHPPRHLKQQGLTTSS